MEPSLQPADAVAAATHRDPYPYYEALRDGPPLRFDARLNVWIASRADAVDAVLGHPALRVRPAGVPVPPAITGSSAAEVFARLVRMNDGAAHAVPKRVLQHALGRVAATQLRLRARQRIGVPPTDPALLSNALFEWPVACVADQIGFAEADLPSIAAEVRAFVACLSPLSDAEALRSSSTAAQALFGRVDTLLRSAQARPQSLLADLQREAHASGWADGRAIAANLIGLMSQSCEATAGWIGNAWVALQREARPHAADIDDFVHEVARHDPAVHSTRRFAAEATSVLGVELASGDAVLLLLAAASRDPARHPRPDDFDTTRRRLELPGFGHGAHACPGQRFGAAIVAAAVEAWLSQAEPRPALRWRYRASVNARIPEFLPIDRSAE